MDNSTEIKVRIYSFDTLEELNLKSQEYNRSWDELINLAIERLLQDIDIVRSLRTTKKFYE